MNNIEVVQGDKESFMISCVQDIRGGIKIVRGDAEYYGAKLELSTDIGSNNFLTLYATSPMQYPFGIEVAFTTVPTLSDLSEGKAEMMKTIHMIGSIKFQTESGGELEITPFEDQKYHFWTFKIEETSNIFFGRFMPYLEVGNVLMVGHLINRSKQLQAPEHSFLNVAWSGQSPFVHRVKAF